MDGQVVAVDDGFWDDGAALAQTLREDPPRIPPVFGYDDVGSALFERITRLPTYYLTRVEWELLRAHAGAIAEAADAPVLAELGSGSAKKTRLLLAACVRLRPTTYVPIDVSRQMLETSAATLTEALPQLAVMPLWGRYEAGLARLRAERPPGRLVVAFLGSNVGNMTPAERGALFAEIAATLRRGDGFLVSADLLKSAAELETCYNDPPGHDAFAAFRLNHLVHVNRRFGSRFDVARFRPLAHFDEATGMVEGHLYTDDAQQVAVPALGLTVTVPAGGSINVGFSAKFDADELVAELAGHGLAGERSWIDERHRYGIFLARRR